MDAGALLVILLYALALAVVLFVSPRLAPESAGRRPWWRSSRLWASFVAIVQIAVYAIGS